MADVQTSRMDANSQHRIMTFCVLICLKMATTFNERIFVKNKKHESGGRLKVKINILLYGDNA
jgi:hypothetical protein